MQRRLSAPMVLESACRTDCAVWACCDEGADCDEVGPLISASAATIVQILLAITVPPSPKLGFMIVVPPTAPLKCARRTRPLRLFGGKRGHRITAASGCQGATASR